MESLANIRISKNMTQKEMAEKIKITKAAYCNIENGKRRPSVDVAKRIGSVLEFDWTKLFEEE